MNGISISHGRGLGSVRLDALNATHGCFQLACVVHVTYIVHWCILSIPFVEFVSMVYEGGTKDNYPRFTQMHTNRSRLLFFRFSICSCPVYQNVLLN